MPAIYVRGTGQHIIEDTEVHAFLEEQGVHYERWSADKTPDFVVEKIVLDDLEKGRLLALYDDEITGFAKKRGYSNWDIAVLSVETPDMLQKFGQVHFHKEDEVRGVVGGKGIFTIKSIAGIGYFELEVSVGDVVIVPERRPHAFKLSDDRKFVVVRLFTGEAGSVTYPVEP